ncbi:lytic transglycosylase domain-containing protein [Citrobacter portucalensis]|uniref:lytic transglycosylase domain-containing protein n=1 Tax=Citrobacter freundii complex TaxID=1344959 RepID=UPI002B386340|nr:lytic transglycosylase domain-containing protein [Citrobacter portucalensis]MEB0895717.1 lytic transglycosylase domain-containing protein [Citrobacter freundii]HBN5237559.1 lytic transglycosylase domain-containing protein [Citrobacter freundii]
MMAQMTERQTAYSRRLDEKYGFPSGTMETLVGNESSGNGNAESPKGARGYAQLMPSVMSDAGYRGTDPRSLPFEKQMDIAANHLNKGVERFGDIGMALAGYNSGNARVNAVRNGKATLPAETADYVSKFADAGIIPGDSEILQFAQAGQRRTPQQPDYADLDKAISQVGDTSAWDAKRQQFKNQEAGQPTASSWEKKRAQFLANEGAGESQQQVAQSNLNPEMEYLSPGLKAAPEQAARGIANIPFDVMDAGVGVVNAAQSAGAWAGQQLGMGDGTYNPMSPVSRPVDRPTDPYAQAGEQLAPYLIPGVGAERTAAAAASVANAPRAERAATQVAGMLAENLPGTLANAQKNGQISPEDLAKETGIGLAGTLGARALIKGGQAAAGAVRDVMRGNANPAGGVVNGLETANDVSKAARSAGGRQNIASQASSISDDVARAAKSTGVDIDTLTPGMRSGSRGIAQAEGVLASTPGHVQDAHLTAFNEISSKLNKQLSDFGAESGSASEKSAAIKDRISATLSDMKNAENTAWDDLRSTMPRDRMKMSNGMAVVQSEKAADVPLSPEMKQFQAANGQSGGITFDGMKAWRAKFADAEQANIRAGKANAARIAGEMRRAITDDMRVMAEKGNFLPEWQKANDLSKGYITAKKNAESVFGRDLASDSMVRKGVDMLKASADSGPGAFHRLITSLPEVERQPAIASILQHAAAQGEKGGVGEGAGLQYFAKIMTPQNVKAISRHAPDLGKIMKEFGVLAKAGTRPQRYIERTGRTTEAIKTLDTGLPKIVGVIMNGIQQSGAIAGGFGGGVMGSIGGMVAGGALRNTVAKIGATRSGRYAIEKAVQEATKAVNAGASPAAIAAAEKRFAANKIAMKAIRDAVGAEGFTQLTRAGIVATLSGMKDDGEEE